jgi:predicted metal-binding protein
MEQMQVYINAALEKGVRNAAIIETSKIFTAPWVRLKCQFGCPLYGKGLCCPPHSPTWEETRKILDSYQYAILLHYEGKTGLDKAFNEIVADLEKTLFLDGYYKAFAMGSGPCRKCAECDPTGSCKNPMSARPSMESCGIDVFKTVREHSFPIQVVRERKDHKDLYGIVLVE